MELLEVLQVQVKALACGQLALLRPVHSAFHRVALHRTQHQLARLQPVLRHPSQRLRMMTLSRS